MTGRRLVRRALGHDDTVSPRPRWLALVLVLASWQVPTLASAMSTPAHISAQTPCGAPRVAPAYQHVVWIFLENAGYSVVGSPSALYLNSLSDHCGLATNYRAISHPSLP
jgi:hypothetical protein